MNVDDLPSLNDPERLVALSYAAAERRPALRALWALDEALAGILRATREPLVGQMRLTWWHGALSGLDEGAVPNQPLLSALAAHVMPLGVAGSALAEMIDGWEVLLEPDPLDDTALTLHAEVRGGRLFGLAAAVLGSVGDDRVRGAGEGWALVDLGLHLRDAGLRKRCLALAQPRLAAAMLGRWPCRLRPLGMLVRLALVDAHDTGEPARRQGSPARLMRMMWHAVSGR